MCNLFSLSKHLFFHSIVYEKCKYLLWREFEGCINFYVAYPYFGNAPPLGFTLHIMPPDPLDKVIVWNRTLQIRLGWISIGTIIKALNFLGF
jgi:hypothetical protein